MSRRAKRAGMWTCASGLLIIAAVVLWSLARPSWFGTGRTVVAAIGGNLEVAWAECALTRQQLAYGMQYPQGSAAILVAPTSAWIPSVASAAVGTGPGGPMYGLRVLYVPLWPWAIVLGVASAVSRRWAGKAIRPGHCSACGYDLSGLADGKCPECGGLVAKVLRLVLAWRRGVWS